MNEKDAKSVEAIKILRKMLKPGDTVYCVLRKVARSGMSRHIDFYIISKNEPRWITGYVGQAVGTPQSDRDWRTSAGLRVDGCGMDMGFHVVYSLGRVLFPDGFIPAKAGKGGRNGADPNQVDTDGGYALNHSWM